MKAITLTITLATACLGRSADKPNILFVLTDDHACRAVGAYGSKINRTPNIDRIATSGAIFTSSFCSNSICGPARASILSGQHSHINGLRTNADRFDGTRPTFINILKRGGYQTAFVGKWHLGSHPTKPGYGIDYWALQNGGYHNSFFTTADGRKRVQGYATDVITDKLLDWLRGRDRDKPFVAVCSYNAAHRTWAPPIKYLTRYQDRDIPEPETLHDDWRNRTATLARNRQSIANHFYYSYDLKVREPVPFASAEESRLKSQEYGRLPPEQRKLWDEAYGPENREFIRAAPTGRALTRWKYQRYIKDYLRCVDSLDDNVGRLLDYLEEDKALDNTLIVYTSDQGFFLGEHGLYDKRLMYEESLRTPWLISWPGKIKPGTRIDQMVQNIDHAPTLIEAAGLEVPECMQGVSILPLLDGSAGDWRQAVYYHYYEHGTDHNAPAHEGVRTRRHKLIHYYRDDGYDLFDLQADPHEMKDVSADPAYREVLADMKSTLARLREEYRLPPLDAGDDSAHQ